jgi:hypothetical protein
MIWIGIGIGTVLGGTVAFAVLAWRYMPRWPG